MRINFVSVTDIEWHWKFIGKVDSQEKSRFIMGYKKGQDVGSVLIDLSRNKEYPIVSQQEGKNLANEIITKNKIIWI